MDKAHENYEYKEMYHPSKNDFNFKLRNPFRNQISFHLPYDVREALPQFGIMLTIGLVLDYVYYQNFSLYYLFIGGVSDWFSILMSFLNYGTGGGYDIFYLIINGIFYFYLFSATISLFYSIISNLNKKGTWTFLVGIGILIFVIFKYFPNIIY